MVAELISTILLDELQFWAVLLSTEATIIAVYDNFCIKTCFFVITFSQ
jgi:hypothetical protein